MMNSKSFISNFGTESQSSSMNFNKNFSFVFFFRISLIFFVSFCKRIFNFVKLEKRIIYFPSFLCFFPMFRDWIEPWAYFLTLIIFFLWFQLFFLIIYLQEMISFRLLKESTFPSISKKIKNLKEKEKNDKKNFIQSWVKFLLNFCISFVDFAKFFISKIFYL